MDLAPASETRGAAAGEEAPAHWLRLSQPEGSELELSLVQVVLESAQWSGGALQQRFEAQFAQWAGRSHAVAVSSGTLGAWLVLRAWGIGTGDEVVASTYGWHHVANAVEHAGARVVFSDIDYWSGCLDPVRASQAVTPKTRAVIAGNVNGHPADWTAFRVLAAERGLLLLEDSTEAIASRHSGRPVGSFGDASLFDFSQPAALCTGEGGMIVTDDAALASELRYLRSHGWSDRRSVSVGARIPLQCAMSDVVAALGLAQLMRIDELLERRKEVEAWYLDEMLSFEGIKPPYVAPSADAVHWMTYVVHLGKRFTASACDQIVEDMAEECIETARYCRPLHQQFHYQHRGWERGRFPLSERIADRAIALPFHAALTRDEVRFIVRTLKDSSVNVGAGAAIYL